MICCLITLLDYLDLLWLVIFLTVWDLQNYIVFVMLCFSLRPWFVECWGFSLGSIGGKVKCVVVAIDIDGLVDQVAVFEVVAPSDHAIVFVLFAIVIIFSKLILAGGDCR